jgi:hypothetical protein
MNRPCGSANPVPLTEGAGLLLLQSLNGQA